jgi:hypothetical protein
MPDVLKCQPTIARCEIDRGDRLDGVNEFNVLVAMA